VALATNLRIKTSALVNGRRDERGTAIVEYLLLVALIAIVAMLAIGLFGLANSSKFANMANSIS
jgi:Flp pilus assembly pilin Flp